MMKNGLLQRENTFRPLKKGDTVTAASNDIYEDTEPFTVESDDISVKIQDLEPGTYRVQVIAVDVNDHYANPISRYCQTYQFLDNFSTTSLEAKVNYELDLDLQFDRTLSYLMLLGGENSQSENIRMFKNAYFPDVVRD